MKYSWDIEYLERKHGIRESKIFMQTRANKMSELHNVPFTWYYAAGRFMLAPFLDYRNVELVIQPELVSLVVEQLKHRLFGRTYLDIHLATDIPLIDIMGMAKYLFTQGKVTFGVGRTGHSVSMRLKK